MSVAIQKLHSVTDAQRFDPSEERVQEHFISLRNVSLEYGEGEEATLALSDVSLAIPKGSFVAVVGPSGCGKSTLMKLFTGLLPPSSGTVNVDGQVVTGPVEGVGMAFQNATLMPWRTTMDNVMLPFEIVEPHIHRLRAHRAEYVAKVERMLANVGLLEFAKHFPWQLSGGMQQRANLCRALIHEPTLLMLDEPFAALDAFTREDLWKVLQQLWIERRFTGVMITHDLREAVYLADIIFVLSKRPGRMLRVERIDLPRPRTLAMTFEPEFVSLVQTLRTVIGEERA